LKKAKFDIVACKVHLSYDMKRVVDIQTSDSFETKKAKLEAEQDVKMGRNDWREKSMSEAEQESRLQMKLASRAYLQDKWGELTCVLKDKPCYRPYPFCPAPCPDNLQFCYAEKPSWTELDNTRNRIHHEFAQQPSQPITPAD
jgi:hypothetical protein